MFINNTVLKNMDYIDLDINKYGHGIDFLTCYVSNLLGYVNKVDDDIAIYHPSDKGYNTAEAERCWRQYEKLIREKYPNFRRKVKSYGDIQYKYEKKGYLQIKSETLSVF